MAGNYIAFGTRSGPDSQHELPSQVFTSGVIGGTGSPQGVVPGVPGQMYEDNSVSPINLWMKIAGTGVTGWQLVGVKAS